MSGSVLRGRKRLSLTPSLTKQKKEEIAEGTQTPQRTPRLLKYGLRTPLAEDKSDFEDELSAQKAKGRVQGVLFHNKENVDSNIVPLSTQTSSPVRTPPSTVAAPPLSPVLLPSQPHLRDIGTTSDGTHILSSDKASGHQNATILTDSDLAALSASASSLGPQTIPSVAKQALKFTLAYISWIAMFIVYSVTYAVIFVDVNVLAWRHSVPAFFSSLARLITSPFFSKTILNGEHGVVQQQQQQLPQQQQPPSPPIASSSFVRNALVIATLAAALFFAWPFIAATASNILHHITAPSSVTPVGSGGALDPKTVDQIAQLVESKINHSLATSFDLLKQHIQKEHAGSIQGVKDDIKHITSEIEKRISEIVASAASPGNQATTAMLQDSLQQLEKLVNEVKANLTRLQTEQQEEQQRLQQITSDLAANSNNEEQLLQQITKISHSVLDSLLKQHEGSVNSKISQIVDELKSNFVTNDKLQEQQVNLEDIQNRLRASMKEIAAEAARSSTFDIPALVEQQLRLLLQHTDSAPSPAPYSVSSNAEIEKLVKLMLVDFHVRDAGVGMTDYALLSSGASVLEKRTSPSYLPPTATADSSSRNAPSSWIPSVLNSWSSSVSSFLLGNKNTFVGQTSPAVMLQADNSVGNCWAFNGGKGHVTIRLSRAIVPRSFTLEHIHKSVAINIGSAPKDFRVWGLKNETDANPVALGKFAYDANADNPIQTFNAEPGVSEEFPFVTLDVLSNHGNSEYTCIYRFRVHDKLQLGK